MSARRLLSAAAALGGALLIAAAVWRGAQALDYHWQWFRLGPMFFKIEDGAFLAGPLLRGLAVTIKISLAAGVLAALIGAAVALAGQSRLLSLRWLARGYVEIMRNTPLLVQLYLLYFMLANVLGLSRTAAGITALAVFEGAFAAEIFRAGLAAVAAGQWEAARSLGLRRAAIYRRIILPQSLPLILPPLANLGVSLLKHSSIVTIIALGDLTDVARNLIADTFMVFEIWLAVAAVYVGLASALSFFIAGWEARIKRRAQGGR